MMSVKPVFLSEEINKKIIYQNYLQGYKLVKVCELKNNNKTEPLVT